MIMKVDSKHLDSNSPGMEKHRGEQTVKLVGPFGVEKGYHAAHVVQAFNLGAERRVLVEVAVHKVAVFLSCDPAVAVYAYAARVTYDLADHVLGHFVFVSSDRKVGVAVKVLLFCSGIVSDKMCYFLFEFIKL